MLATSVSAVTRRGSRAVSTSAAALASHQLPYTETYLHNSRIPTLHFQGSLPRLPIPDLNETLDKYLRFVEPLVSAEQLTATRTAVEDFRANAGPRAQAALISDDDHHPHTSYISEMWYDMYLRDRSPLPINITPQVTWRMDDNPAKNEQAVRAADICHAAARYYAALKSNVLLPDAFHTKAHITKNPAFEQMVKLLPSSLSYYPAVAAGAYALDMSQYARLFCSTRVPHRSKDELRSAEHCNFAIAIRGSDLFKVRLFEGADGDVDGQHLKVFSPSQIEAQIRAVLAAKPSGLPRVAALTEMNRDEWADAREHMETSPMNRASLADVDRALFVISLDDSTPETHEELSRAMLHGGERDRWFDKCFNIAVCKNGRAGISWEHAWGDGVAVLNFFNEVYTAITDMPAREHASAASMPAPERLGFHFDDKTAATVASAVEHTERTIKEMDLDVFRSETMNKEDVKRSKLGPDGLMQLIMQLAHVRAHGYTPSTYESATTAAFKHGRTEVIRPATNETVAVCKAFNNPTATHEEKYRAMQASTALHSKITTQCMMGKGVDRHLFALRKWCERIGTGPQAIFDDGAYGTFTDIRLSTSTLQSPALDGGGFGPVSRTSYGVGYGIEPRGAQFHVASFGQGNKEFIAGLDSTLVDVQATIAAIRGEGKPEEAARA